MFSIRQILVPTVFLAVATPAALNAASDTVQYVGGTVKSIPVNTAGTFNFDDAKEFRFLYGGSMYKVPYDQITSTEIQKADVRHILRVIPIETPVAPHRKQTLVINYTDASGAAGTLNFELMAYRAEEAQQTITAKKSPISPASVAAESNEWWGDTIWKTKRNLPMWQAQEAAVKASQEQEAAKKAQQAAAAQQGELPAAGSK